MRRACEFPSWHEFASYLDTNAELMTNWIDGFEAGVNDPRYSFDDDCETDQPWCLPWAWDAYSDSPYFKPGDCDCCGRPVPEAIYWFARRYAEGLRNDIVELLDEDEANKAEDEAQELEAA